MIKVNKGEVEMHGDLTELMTETILAIVKLKDLGVDSDILLGGIISGMYLLKDKESHQDCYKLGKFIDYKCKELKNREN